jgi:hypothetical protein
LIEEIATKTQSLNVTIDSIEKALVDESKKCGVSTEVRASVEARVRAFSVQLQGKIEHMSNQLKVSFMWWDYAETLKLPTILVGHTRRY